MPVPVRFGSHAVDVHKNGWLPIVPVYGKSGLERNWPMAGWTPPTREAVQGSALRHPNANIGFVMDGKTVVIDVDQTDLKVSAAVAGLAEDALLVERAGEKFKSGRNKALVPMPGSRANG